MAEESLVIRIVGDASSYTRTIAQVEAGIKRATTATQSFGHGTVSQTQAASAAIRTLEGGISNNIRAVERFITTIPGVGKALQALFPVIGSIATIGVFAKMGQEFYQFIQQVNAVPKALQQGFQQLTGSSQLANDELRKTNDTLQEQIDKLSGKRENTLAVDLDQARINADKLAQSLQTDMERVNQLLKANQISGIGAILTGKGGTSNVTGSVQSYESKLSDLGYQYAQATGQGNNGLAASIKSQIDATRASGHAYAKSQIADRRSGQHTVGDQSANITILEGFDQFLTDSQTREQLESQNNQLSAKQKQLQANKDFATQARDAQQKSDEAQIAAGRQNLTDLKSNEDLTINQEASYWIDRASTLNAGSKAYSDALNESRKDVAAQVKQNGDLNKAFNVSAALEPNAPDLGNVDESSLKKQSSTTIDFLKSLNDGTTIQRQQSTALAEASLQQQVATGQMSAYDAALVQAQLHTQEYTEQLGLLKDALSQVQGNDVDAQNRRAGLNNQISSLNGQRAVQVIEDNGAINSNTLSGSFSTTLNKFVQQATDTAAQIRDIFTNSIDSINSSLSQSLLAPSHSGQQYRRNILNGLAGATRGIGSNVLNAGFHQVEGGALSALGLGGGKKPTGTAGDPLHVVMAGIGGVVGSASSSVSKVGNFLSHLLRGGGGGGGSSAAGLDTDNDTSGLGEIASIPLAGFFANGGDILAGHAAVVGDGGRPELFVPHTAGHIYPDASAFGGSSVTHNHYVDARGSSNPAETEAAVDRAMRRYAPSLVRQSVSADREYSARRPASKR